MSNILIIPDTHIPFEKNLFLDFCKQTQEKYKCKLVIHIGDIVDNHSISQHAHDPDGHSPYKEYQESIKKLKLWYKAFPSAMVCVGNHDERIEKAAKRFGLSSAYFKDFKELWQFPKKWEYKFDYYYYGIRFFHGMGYSGKNAHMQAVTDNRCSCVMGHIHTNAGVDWTASEKDLLFGMALGCGIDRGSYAFGYGRDFRKKPIIGCGVIEEGGKYPQFVPMIL